jgi:hypothetical protein
VLNIVKLRTDENFPIEVKARVKDAVKYFELGESVRIV